MRRKREFRRMMECECGVTLMNVYVRGGKIFERLEGRYYCPACDELSTTKLEVLP